MQKPKVLDLITNLESFLDTVQSVNNHPYSSGIDVDKLITDLKDYLKDMKTVVEQIQELQPDINEPEEISE